MTAEESPSRFAATGGCCGRAKVAHRVTFGHAGTIFDLKGQHRAPLTLEEPAPGATEQPRATGLSVVSKMDMTLPGGDADKGPVEYQQWLLYALMQFGKTEATQLGNYVLHAVKAVIPAILLENRNSTESQRKFIMQMRQTVRNFQTCCSWILERDRQRCWGVQGQRCFGSISESRFLEKARRAPSLLRRRLHPTSPHLRPSVPRHASLTPLLHSSAARPEAAREDAQARGPHGLPQQPDVRR